MMRLIDADEIVKVAEHAHEQWSLAMVGADDTRKVNEVFKKQYLCKVVKAVAQNCPTVDAVILPCKPMDTVYFIECRTDGNHKIRSGLALSVEYSVCYKPLVTIRYDDNTTESTKHYLGLKAFMTREEAEAALAKMDGEKDG